MLPFMSRSTKGTGIAFGVIALTLVMLPSAAHSSLIRTDDFSEDSLMFSQDTVNDTIYDVVEMPGYNLDDQILPGAITELPPARIRDWSLTITPNPISGQATIILGVPHRASVCLEIYNASGRLVQRLMNEHKEAGLHNLCWDGKDTRGRTVSVGVYFYRLQTDDVTVAKRAVLVR
ncbi:hypothetical protein CH330_01805 [candidate division WOR-3 bacterium JGI_Cruoil_03_51_56]|uniref:FlgD/Vpr Ig-like domain-containing protein n=1 Tax=candidate division WOR-3 bacterium JGI_Cruoil_03_51_56 TaxID=1973747 RepID=A0A235BZ20_UNCW3|nr:MAG: hypothetical protein CH330_01805 [candidate division WOR-3 bacterium JGI_Cruoil_03_51_56]